MSKIPGFKNVMSKQFFRDLWTEFNEDELFDGAATLAYYWMLALFPAMIFLLSLLPYLPIDNLYQAIMDFLGEALPEETVSLLSRVISEVTDNEHTGLLSFGFLVTIWAASSGMYAIMRQLNRIHDVEEARSFVRARVVATALTLTFGLVVLMAFSLIVFGGYLQTWAIRLLAFESAWLLFFKFFRWSVIVVLLLSGFSLLYYFGPNVKQEFRFITPGSILGSALLILASLGFQYYVNGFSNYSATYGSIGAVIVLMFWLYIAGIVILLGSEINAVLRRYQTSSI